MIILTTTFWTPISWHSHFNVRNDERTMRGKYWINTDGNNSGEMSIPR